MKYFFKSVRRSVNEIGIIQGGGHGHAYGVLECETEIAFLKLQRDAGKSGFEMTRVTEQEYDRRPKMDADPPNVMFHLT